MSVSNYLPDDPKPKGRFRIRYNAPVTLTFALVSLAVLGLGYITKDWTTTNLFSVYRSNISFYWFVRLFGHTLGHSGWSHFVSNMTLFLLLGPVLEEKYGSKNLLEMMGIAAVIAAIFQMIFFPGVALLGASGIVFMMIILTSAVNIREGGIPLTMILVILIYLGSELWDTFTAHDNISHLTHILGGICGAVFGFIYAKDPKLKETTKL